MNLQLRTLVALGLTLLAFIAAAYIGVRQIVIRNSADLERVAARQELNRAEAALRIQCSSLEVIAWGWAHSDALAGFLAGIDDSSDPELLSAAALATHDLACCAILDAQAKLVKLVLPPAVSRGRTSELTASFEKLQTQFSAPNWLSGCSARSGLLWYGDQLMLTAACPIPDNVRMQGAGTLVLARIVDDRCLSAVQPAFGSNLELHHAGGEQTTPELTAAIAQLKLDGDSIVQLSSPTELVAYSMEYDLLGQPSVVLRSEMPRRIVQQTSETLRYLLMIMCLSTLTTFIVSLILIQHLLLSRIQQLVTGLKQVTEGHRADARVDELGQDELGHLSKAVNELLASIEQSQDELRCSEEKYRNLVESMSEGITMADTSGNYTFANRAALELFGAARAEVIGHNVREFIATSDLHVLEQQVELRHAGEMTKYELHIQRKNGSTRLVQVDGRPLHNTSGAVIGAFAIMQDITEHRAAQAQLEKRTDELQAIINAFPDLYFHISESGILLDYKTNNYDDLYELPERFLGRPYTEILPPQVSATLATAIQRMYSSGQPTSAEYAMDMHGQQRYFEARLCPLVGRQVLAIVRDITPLHVSEKVRAALFNISEATSSTHSLEELLVRVQTELRHLVDTTNFYVALYDDASGTYSFPYVVDQRDSDYHQQRIDGSLTDLVRMSGVPLLVNREQIGTMIQQGLITTLYGSAPESWLGVPLKTGRHTIGVVVVQSYHAEASYDSRDLELLAFISEHIALAIERKLAAEKQQHLVAAVEHTSDAVMITDTAGKIQYVNESFVRTTGYRMEQALGKTPAIVSSGQHSREFYSDLWHTILRGDVWRGRLTNKRSDGTLFEEDATISPILNENQEISSFVAVKRDVTEAVALQAKLQQAAKMESLGVLASGIAHDFNNLLTGILGNASLAQMDLAPASPVQQHIVAIEKTAQRAADLARQMLAYSGRTHFALHEMNLSSVVKEMAGLVEVSVPKKVTLRLQLAAELPPILGDATQIGQVILNLLTNAADAIGDQRGMISVCTGVAWCDRSYLNTAWIEENLAEGDYAFVEVSDSGCGMSQATLSRIFDPFFTTKPTGHGLGLAAVLGIIRGHHGAIKVYSEPGRGTTFKALFPIAHAGTLAEPESQHEVIPWHGSGTVLIVDDEPTVLRVSQRMLEQAGFSVLTAEDGRQALEVFSQNAAAITLVLLDMAMPYMNGDEVFHEIRRMRGDAKVLLTSGYSQAFAASELLDCGLAGFLEKPFRSQELLDVVREILEPPLPVA